MKRIISLSLLLTMLFGAMFGIMPAAEDGELVIKSAQVEFGTTVFLNIAVDFSGIADADTSKISLEVTSRNGKKVTLAPDAAIENVPEGCVAFKYTKLSAKNMGDKVKLQAYYDGVANGDSVDYSVLQYSIVAKYENPKDTEFCELVDAMLAFGAAAQQVFLLDGEDIEEKYNYDLAYEDGYCYVKLDESVNATTCDLDDMDSVSEAELALLRKGTVWPIGRNLAVTLLSGELVYDQNMVWRIRTSGSLFDDLADGYIRAGEAVTLYQLPRLQHVGRYSSDRLLGGLNLKPRPADNGTPDLSIKTQDFSDADIFYITDATKGGNKFGSKFTLSFAIASVASPDAIYLRGESYRANGADGKGTSPYPYEYFQYSRNGEGYKLPLLTNYGRNAADDGFITPGFIRPVYSNPTEAFSLIWGCAYGNEVQNIQALPGAKTNHGAFTLIHIVFDCTDPAAMKMEYYVGNDTTCYYRVNTNIPLKFFTAERFSDFKRHVMLSFDGPGSDGTLEVMSVHITKGDVRYASEWARYYD